MASPGSASFDAEPFLRAAIFALPDRNAGGITSFLFLFRFSEACLADDTPTTLDVTGYRCPMPVIRMEAALRRMAPGSSLIVRADDPVAALDIPHFCREAGHEARRQPDQGPEEWPICVFLVTRGPNPA